MKTELNILQTAFRLFLGKGFSDISTNEIIREAGATKGGFYYCFKSREDLVGKVIETYLRPYYLQPLEEMRQDGTSLKIIEKYLDDPQKYLEVDDLGY